MNLKKSFFTLVLLLTISSVSYSQIWKVGEPIYQEVLATAGLLIEATAECDSLNPDGINGLINLPLPEVTGVSYYFHITGSKTPNDSIDIFYDSVKYVMHVNDSILIKNISTDTCFGYPLPCEVVSFGYAGPHPQTTPSQFGFNVMAVGTPTVAGETYPSGGCKAWYSQGPGCQIQYYIANVDFFTGDTCFSLSSQVEAPTQIKDPDAGISRIYPNPATDHVIIETKSNLSGKKFQILDNIGRIILSGILNPTMTEVDMTALPSGIYLLDIPGVTSRFHKILKQ